MFETRLDNNNCFTNSINSQISREPQYLKFELQGFSATAIQISMTITGHTIRCQHAFLIQLNE